MTTPFPLPPLVVRFEKSGRGGKTVTVIAGLRIHPEGQEVLLTKLKKKLGTGGAVKKGLLELQGDQRERLPPLLIALGHRVIKGN